MKTIRDIGIIPFTPAADYRSYKGYLVTLAADTATVNASTSVLSKGVIVDVNDTAAGYASEKVTIALLGCGATVPMRLGGSVTKGAFVQQHSDGTVITDAASGARVIVGLALETGVAGENIEVFTLPAESRS